jgi:Icc-related predicted phosphoesterase
MVKILAIGDFHGKFPSKLKDIIKKEKIDFVLSTGDFFPWGMKKIFFKYCYNTSKNLWDVLGKKKYKQLTLKDLKDGEKKVIKKLNNLPVQVFTTTGNYDLTNINDHYPADRWNTGWNWADHDFLSPILKKYPAIKRVDYSFAKYKDFVIIGGIGHSSPGDVKSKAYKKHKKILEKLFNRFKKENKQRKLIFLFHNMPYMCGKLDLINDKKADKSARGKHFGAKLTRKIIDKYHPVLGIGGHMHENQGKCKIGKTLVINPGAAVNKKAVIIDFDEEKGKVERVKFVR